MSSDYPFLSIFWTMVIFFAWVIWIWLVIRVFADVLRRDDVSGWGKTAWIIFVIVLPYLGVFIYLIAQGQAMGRRDIVAEQQARAAYADYVRSVSATGGTAEIERAKALLNAGTITQAEFDSIKAKALA